VRLGKRHVALILLLGAAVAAIPTMAGGTATPSVSAVNFAFVGSNNSRPAAVAIMPGGSVEFTNTNGLYKHDVFFKGPVPASCSDNGNPGPILGPTEASPGTTLFPAVTWNGACTFTKPGAYTFYCTVHLFEGTIYVNSEGVVPTTTTTTTSTTTSTTPTTTSTTTTTTFTPPPSTTTTQTQTSSTSSAPGSTSPVGTPEPNGPAGPGERAGEPPVLILALVKGAHGATVRGSTEVAPLYGGSRLEVDLVARGAASARAKHAAPTLLGRFVRASVPAGKVSFAVSLNARGRSLLRRRGRLAVTVRIVLTPPGGSAVTVTQGVVLRR
jgi:plastocyanin